MKMVVTMVMMAAIAMMAAMVTMAALAAMAMIMTSFQKLQQCCQSQLPLDSTKSGVQPAAMRITCTFLSLASQLTTMILSYWSGLRHKGAARCTFPKASKITIKRYFLSYQQHVNFYV